LATVILVDVFGQIAELGPAMVKAAFGGGSTTIFTIVVN
jgi:hypothetical protein